MEKAPEEGTPFSAGSGSRLSLLPFAVLGPLLLTAELLFHAFSQGRKIERALALLSVRPELSAWVIEGGVFLLLQAVLLAVLFGLLGGLIAHVVAWLSCATPLRGKGSWGTAVLFLLPVWAACQLETILRHPGIYPFSDFYVWWASSAVPWSASIVLLFVAVSTGAVRHLMGKRRGAPAVVPWTLGGLLLLFLLYDGRSLPDQPTYTVAPSAPSAIEPRHIVVISVDALRPDRIGALGHGSARTPHMDAFLEEAQVFTSAWTSVARTGPSWMSLFTGSDPREHGFLYDLPDPALGLPYVATLPQRLQEIGWLTSWFCDDSRFFPVDSAWGFDFVVQPSPTLANFALGGQGVGIPLLAFSLSSRVSSLLAPQIAQNSAFSRSYRPESFIRRIQKHLRESQEGEEPTFTAIHLTGLHAPSDRRYPFSRYPGVLTGGFEQRTRYSRRAVSLLDEDDPDAPPGWPYVGFSVSGRAFQRIGSDWAIYDAGVSDLDQQVGALLSAVFDSADLARTIVVLWSDHGESIGRERLNYPYSGPNHGFHGWTAEAEKILLAVYGPGWEPAVRSEMVTPAEVGRTLARAVGVPEGPGSGGTLESPNRTWLDGESGITQQRYLPPGAQVLPVESFSDMYDARGPSGPPFVRASFHQPLLRSGFRWRQSSQLRSVSWELDTGHRAYFHYKIGPQLVPETILDDTDQEVGALREVDQETSTDPQVGLWNVVGR